MRHPTLHIMIALLSCTAALGVSRAASASEAAHEHEHAHYHDILGVRLVAGAGLFRTTHSPHRIVGAMASYEHSVTSWAELEINAGMVKEDAHQIVPLELMLKAPWHVTHHLDLFLSFGSVAMVGLHHVPTIQVGTIHALGAYVWYTEHAGLSFEANHVMVHAPETVHEIEASMGVSWRF